MTNSDSILFLSGLMAEILAKAEGRKRKIQISGRIVDTPDIAKEILINTKSFVKNYHFLEYLSLGRFSANPPEWEKRSQITSLYFSAATKILDKNEVKCIYFEHLKRLQSGQGDLYQNLIAAAVQVASRMFGLTKPIPWPIDLIEEIRSNLTTLQLGAWVPIPEEVLKKNQLQLKKNFSKLKIAWSADIELKNVFNAWSINAKDSGISEFSPEGELVQNLFAATETTVAAIQNILDCLSRQGDSLRLHEKAIHMEELQFDSFIKEALRLYPPVPIVTRKCLHDTLIQGETFKADEVIIISILGIHRSPDFWEHPTQFQLNRKEFIEKTYPNHAYIPFLFGPRICAGMKLAHLEIQAALAAIVELFRILPAQYPPQFDYGISFRPHHPILLEKRIN
jgi:hypothetical protein